MAPLTGLALNPETLYSFKCFWTHFLKPCYYLSIAIHAVASTKGLIPQNFRSWWAPTYLIYGITFKLVNTVNRTIPFLPGYPYGFGLNCWAQGPFLGKGLFSGPNFNWSCFLKVNFAAPLLVNFTFKFAIVYLSPSSEELGYFAKRVVASKTRSGPRRQETVLSSAGDKAREASSG